MPRCISRTSPDVSSSDEILSATSQLAHDIALEARREAPGQGAAKVRTVGDDLEECRSFHRRTKLTANAFDFR